MLAGLCLLGFLAAARWAWLALRRFLDSAEEGEVGIAAIDAVGLVLAVLTNAGFLLALAASLILMGRPA